MHHTRREFLQQTAAWGTVFAAGLGGRAADQDAAKPAFSTLTLISVKPRARGRQYGSKFKESIKSFLDKELYAAFGKENPPQAQLRYAGQCLKAIKELSPIIYDELEGMAEGSGL